jgi:hypothetical protein
VEFVERRDSGFEREVLPRRLQSSGQDGWQAQLAKKELHARGVDRNSGCCKV